MLFVVPIQIQTLITTNLNLIKHRELKNRLTERSNLAVLPDDYYKKKISFNDDFWRINIDTGEAIKIYETTDSEANAYNAKELILPPLEDYLLFINQKDDLLYSLEL